MGTQPAAQPVPLSGVMYAELLHESAVERDSVPADPARERGWEVDSGDEGDSAGVDALEGLV